MKSSAAPAALLLVAAQGHTSPFIFLYNYDYRQFFRKAKLFLKNSHRYHKKVIGRLCRPGIPPRRGMGGGCFALSAPAQGAPPAKAGGAPWVSYGKRVYAGGPPGVGVPEQPLLRLLSPSYAGVVCRSRRGAAVLGTRMV